MGTVNTDYTWIDESARSALRSLANQVQLSVLNASQDDLLAGGYLPINKLLAQYSTRQPDAKRAIAILVRNRLLQTSQQSDLIRSAKEGADDLDAYSRMIYTGQLSLYGLSVRVPDSARRSGSSSTSTSGRSSNTGDSSCFEQGCGCLFLLLIVAGVVYWLRPSFLFPVETYKTGQRVQICDGVSTARLNNLPFKTDAGFAQLNAGEPLVVVNGPVLAEEQSWWLVKAETGAVGWLVQGKDDNGADIICSI